VGVSTAEFGASALGGEHPFDARAGSIALVLPGGDFSDEPLALGDAPVEALAASTPISISTVARQSGWEDACIAARS
jgi:hypothetical protein